MQTLPLFIFKTSTALPNSNSLFSNNSLFPSLPSSK